MSAARLTQIMVAICLMAGLANAAPAARDPQLWYEDWRQAEAAVAESGKPLYVYVWKYLWRSPHMTAQQWSRLKEDNPSSRMNESTLADKQVKLMLRDYVHCDLEVNQPPNRDFIHEHAPGLLPDTEDDQAGYSAYRLPFHLFFDSSGEKIFQIYGYIPTQWFTQTLEAVKLLIKGRNSTEGQLQQARAYARLGHICLELELYQEAKKNLQRTIELDPANKSGAKASAELDLIIISIPDAPDEAARSLEIYLKDHPHSPRRCELRYFLAVAHYLADHHGQAIDILQQFERMPNPSSEQEKRWIEHAAVLLDQLRPQR